MGTIETQSRVSKVKQLFEILSHDISNRMYEPGQALPSINELSAKFNVSRDTVVKAFNKLKAQKIIESVPAKGYFVVQATIKVLLVLDTYSPFKHDFYKELVRNLPDNYTIDLLFHQYEEERFNKIISESVEKYNFYLVMNLRNDKYCQILDKIDYRRLMLIDFGAFEKEKFAYVCQGFDTTLYECMIQGLNLFSKYRKLTMVYPPKSEHPASSITYFKKFCSDFGFDQSVAKSVYEGMVEPGTAYLIVNHSHLIDLMKICCRKNYELGKDIGVVVFNDEPMLEIIDKGVTAISTNFSMMGRIASEFIKNRKKIQTYVPTQLIVRGTL